MDEEALSESRESETFDEEDEYSSEEDSEDSASSDEESASNDEESASSEEDAEDHIHPHAPGAHQPNSAPPGTFRLCEHNFGSNTASSDFDWDGDPSTLAVSELFPESLRSKINSLKDLDNPKAYTPKHSVDPIHEQKLSSQDSQKLADYLNAKSHTRSWVVANSSAFLPQERHFFYVGGQSKQQHHCCGS
ncbi:hypothetical protein PtB15_14B16 [Puccinia triticina]|nr:hypothetical protein PtB15_14B16 [Puccinia triticina]